ncbi:hypothetical protein [Pseudoalteromonas piscicida]|uniref:hypothetical protein n=1 Tax=Pseudoalteromonas piscicida TaxID=43662 RepID=UPI0005FA8858|nr:hypothetical protein [Pseudoalteromonas piscicida]KJY89426.1 hypothetical protein TW73_21745 [Pseudoalteromonas piscicida]
MNIKNILYLLGLIFFFIPWLVIFTSFGQVVIGIFSYLLVAAYIYKKITDGDKFCGLCNQEFKNSVYKFTNNGKTIKICAGCQAEVRKKMSRKATKHL